MFKYKIKKKNFQRYPKRNRGLAFWFFLIPLLLTHTSFAQSNPSDISSFFNQDVLKTGPGGICVMDLENGKTLLVAGTSFSLTPASTLKIVTTSAAIGILGADFTYQTQIGINGTLDSISGIVTGDIIIKGSGDPSLGSAYFQKTEDKKSIPERWAQWIKEKGVKKVIGKIIADASCFDAQIPSDWIWGDMGNYYGAGANGLSYRDNKYTLYYESKEEGSMAACTGLFPKIEDLDHQHHVLAKGKDDNAIIYGAPFQFNRAVSGTIPPFKKNYEVDGCIPDPALLLAQELHQELWKVGISIGQKAQSSYDKAYSISKIWFAHQSPRLEQLVYYTNLKSDNHYAESLLKTIAWHKTKIGNTENGIKEVVSFWKSKGWNTQGLFMKDGSGLSRSNGISAQQQAQLLYLIYTLKKIYIPFFASLPVAGHSGSLTHFGNGTALEKNLHAKSGYIERARGYCGYMSTKSGKKVSLSCLLNNYNCSPSEAKKMIEKMLLMVYEQW